MDIDNDGIDEYFVVSNGLNDDAWGFKNFIAVIKQLSTPDENGRNWRFLFFETFDKNERPAYHLSAYGFVRFQDVVQMERRLNV